MLAFVMPLYIQTGMYLYLFTFYIQKRKTTLFVCIPFYVWDTFRWHDCYPWRSWQRFTVCICFLHLMRVLSISRLICSSKISTYPELKSKPKCSIFIIQYRVQSSRQSIIFQTERLQTFLFEFNLFVAFASPWHYFTHFRISDANNSQKYPSELSWRSVKITPV